MSYLSLIYHEVFYRPLLNGLLFLTDILPGNDLGFSVILLTLMLRVLMFPLTHKMLHTQNTMKSIEPEIKKIYSETANNKEEQSKRIMELYKKHGINPFSGFLTLLIQFPLLFAMYSVFWKGLPFNAADVYGFLAIPAHINTYFLGFINLTLPNIGFAGLSAVSQLWQIKLATPPKSGNAGKPDMQSMMQKQMLYVFPVIIFVIGFKLPAAVALYWTTMNLFAIVHEAIVRKKTGIKPGFVPTSI